MQTEMKFAKYSVQTFLQRCKAAKLLQSSHGAKKALFGSTGEKRKRDWRQSAAMKKQIDSPGGYMKNKVFINRRTGLLSLQASPFYTKNAACEGANTLLPYAACAGSVAS